MKKLLLLTALVALGLHARASEDGKLLQKLKDAKMSLGDAISYAEKLSGPATSAKFEMDGDQLVFSVYTAPQGLQVPAEDNELSEVSGSATATTIQGKVEIFTDKAHIARAATHLALMQLSRMNLKEIIAKALQKENGIVFSVKNPQVRNHKAVADVSILDEDGDVEVISVDLQ